MNSEQGTEANPHNEPLSAPQRRPRHPEGSETAYERLTSYAFARRYVEGKTVADMIVLGRWKGGVTPGAGSLLLAEGAQSVEVLLLGGGSPESTGSTRVPHHAPTNVVQRRVDLPELPYPEGSFDVVVAFGVLEELGERPEGLLGEARRVLKEDGVLLLSCPDKRADVRREPGGGGGVDARRVGMYAGELRELLGRHFGVVRLYRQGAVAGGLLFPEAEPDGTTSSQEEGATFPEGPLSVEVGRFSLTEPALTRLGAQPPLTRSVIAVCCDEAGALGLEEGQKHEQEAYLLLDHDRGVFEESEDLAEDVELMLGEIEQMQHSEVQAFVEAIRIQRQQSLSQLQMRYLFYIRSYLGHRRNAAREEALHLRNLILEEVRHRRNIILENVRHRRNIIHGNIHALRMKGVKGSVRGALRRSFILRNLPHVRNVILENVRHRRNIIHGNIHALRMKGVKGSVRGALRRLSVLYRRLATKRPD